MYPLYVGLHSYTSGLERLCKLSIACYGFATGGSFPELQKFSHRLGELLDAVAALDLHAVPGMHKQPGPYLTSHLDPMLTDFLERYANGAGRYEHLDSLWKDRVEVASLDTWTELCAKVAVSDRVQHLLAMRGASIDAIRTLCSRGDLESVGYGILDPIDQPMHELSIGVVLQMYIKAAWVASVLDAVTYYTRPELPLLGEAVQDLKGSGDVFFQYAVAKIEDEVVAEEELAEHFKRHPPFGDDS